MPFSEETISKPRLRRTASRWQQPEGSGRTFYLPLGVMPTGVELPKDVEEALRASDTGGVLFWSLAEAKLVLPPFPVDRQTDLAGWQPGQLQSLLDKPRRILVVLVRLGGFAVGIFEGERLMASKVDAPYVHGRNRAGGSSSNRYRQRRVNQSRMLFDKACETLRNVVETYALPPQHLVLGGDRLTVLDFEKRCPMLARYRTIRLGRFLTDVPDPRLEVLKDTPRQFYSSRVITFRGLPPGKG